MNLPFDAPFTIQTVKDWVEALNPRSIFMTDRQYAHLCNLVGMNAKLFNGIPIYFLDKPQR
jgi:hypothetical protein